MTLLNITKLVGWLYGTMLELYWYKKIPSHAYASWGSGAEVNPQGVPPHTSILALVKISSQRTQPNIADRFGLNGA